MVAAGQNITYTEVVTDNGPAGAASGSITVYMQTPANTTFQANGGTNWACTVPTAGTAGPVVCTYNAALASGAPASALTVIFQVSAGTAAGTTIQSSATVTNSTLVDPIPSNNTSVTSVVVEPTTSSDLGLTMSVSPTPVFVFSNFTYTIQIQNLGQLNAPITGGVLTDNLPASVTFVSYTASSTDDSVWTCSGTTSISCSITSSPMTVGATATISITVKAPPTATTVTNTASLTLSGDPNSANDSATGYTVVQPLVCATPGADHAGGTLTGIVNTYFPPANTGTLASSSTSVVLGASSGAATPVAVGDLLLIIQMQAASIDSNNASDYGDGLPGDPGSGSTSLGSSGLFEFVTATSAVPVGGGTLQFMGSGQTGGLLNSYSKVTATTTQAQQTYQVIRVPQYTTATLGAGLVPFAWNGSLGGVLAIDVSSQLTLSGTVSVDGLGFRGGAGRLLAGAAGTAATDYVTAATTAANGSKGEGIAGSPRYIAPSSITTASTATDTTGGTPADTLPGGSYARGAPGNAGGGGTDGHPTGNDYNSGGGAGANGGTGGQGGYGWDSMAATNSTDGGFGGAAFPASTSALVMGGAGGAGTTNNGTYYISSTNNGNGNGIFSSGGYGGGIVIVHAGSVTGTGSITANGQSSQSTLNDSTGGAGAGGSILVFANSGGLSGLTVNANGGNGGNAWPGQAAGTPFIGTGNNRHGPGGGGGGGVIFLTAAPASASVNGGANGYTTLVQDSYGATPGQAGIVATTHIITETPGTQSGAYCASADLSVTNSASPTVVAPGGSINYTQTVKNAGPLDAVNAVFSEATPANTTFQSINTVAGWNCTTPAVGGTGTITCTNPDFASGGSVTFTPVLTVVGGTPAGTMIVDVDNITSGTSDPNLANNTATAITTVGSATQADLAITNTASSPTVTAGTNVTMTAVVINNGPAAAAGAVFTETIPANTTLGVAFTPPSGWSCNTIPVGGTGTFTCTTGTFAALASSTFSIVLNVNSGTAAGTVISDEADIAGPTSDPNSSNNSAIATTIVATPGQADLAVSASGVPNPVTPGNNITYTQSVTNNGPAAITASGTTSVTFTEAIPANTVLASAFAPPSGWNCNSIAVGATGTFTCTLNSGQTFGVGAIVNFPLVVKVVAGTAPGTIITNTPTIASSVSDPYSPNNTATVNTTVASPTQAIVTIVKTASPEPVNQGTILTYTILVTNGGPAVAQGVVVTDSMPSQVAYVSSSSSQGTCSYSAPTVTCTIGSLGVGSVAVVTINTTAMVISSSSYSTNTATVNWNPNQSASSSFQSTIQYPTAVDISSFSAYRQPDGSVRLVWRTHEESRNLGFHVYREDASGRHRLDPALIAGSALLLRGSKPQHAAKSYSWIDPHPSPDAAYWIEDVDVNGARALHGPAYPEEIAAASSSVSVRAQIAEAPGVSPALGQLRTVVPPRNATRRLSTPLPAFPVPQAKVPPFHVADHVAVQISVDQEGWYHIPFAQLFAAGLDAITDLRSLHLYAEGVEQPLLLVGHSSGWASPTDAVEFYGTGIDTPFSGTRVYWLIRENSSGRRILPSPVSNSGGNSPTSFPFTVICQDRTVYFAALLNGENNDNFFGAVVTSDPVDQILTIAHRDTSSSQPLTLDLTLQGATDQQEHSVSIQFNGSPVGTFNFYGEILATQSFSVDPSLVVDGDNTVTLTALNGDNDVSVVQSIQLHYLHTYSADGDWLRATAGSGSELHISGFASQQIRVFDITDPLNISQLNGKVALDSGAYTVSVVIPGGSPAVHTLLAFSDDTLSSPLSLAYHTPTFLDDRHAGADIVMITHPDFVSHLTPLVNLRQSQGYQVAVVTTTQLYDEYNYGERSPFAIRSYLQDAATHVRRKPQAVLLVGGASLDPRNYLGFGDFDFVPTRMIETAAFKTASDDWFTDFLQNGYATIPTGRLPVRTAADIDLVVSKIVGYEQGNSAGAWNSQALLIADQNVDANFTSAVTSESAILPKSIQASQILTDGVDPSTARSQIVAALNTGALLVDYDGHGAEQQWSFADIFDTNDAAALTNGGQLPVYLLADCLNGLFQDVYAQSLAESLLLAPNGGAVAVWASSGFTNQPPQVSMNLAFLNGWTAHPNQTIGRLVLNAKSVTTDNDVRRTWILFGDPAMRFHFAASSSSSSSNTAPASSKDFHHGCSTPTLCPKEIE
ncbi:MAG TPA: C25 family cysteine peptidase [Bryobacteraceae bacterium]|nr:C25 family cysteine peptidase [Bryobacteraceae bacterium]